jgi:type IV secretory pathway VirJ component
MSKIAEKTVLVNSALDNFHSACEDLVLSKAKLFAIGGEELFTHIEVYLHDEENLNRASKALQDAIELTLNGAETITPGETYALHSSIAEPEVVAPKEKKSRKKVEAPAQEAPVDPTPVLEAPAVVAEAPVVAPAPVAPVVEPTAPVATVNLDTTDMDALKSRANELLKQYAKKTTVVTAQTLINDVGGSGRLSLFDRATLLKLIETVTALV